MKKVLALSFLFLLLPFWSAFGEQPRPLDSREISLSQAIILGVVEGITEYLPVSSTGHLILAADAMHLSGFARDETGAVVFGPLGPIMQPNPAINAFNIVIQIGAILAVVGLYFPRIREMQRGLVGQDSQGRKLLIHLLIAFMPAAIFGLLLDELIERYLFSPITVCIALALGGVAMLSTVRLYKRDQKHVDDLHHLTARAALIIGLMQCLALWPGTSRSMVTILGGLCAGLSMRAAAEFSFLLALPTLGAATVYKIVTQWDCVVGEIGFDSLLAGIVVSSIVAALSVKFLIYHLTRHGLGPFGIYRIVLAIGVLYHFSS